MDRSWCQHWDLVSGFELTCVHMMSSDDKWQLWHHLGVKLSSFLFFHWSKARCMIFGIMNASTPWTAYSTVCSLHTSALMKALRISPQFIRSLGRAMYPSFYSISPCPTAARLLSPYRTRHRLDFKIQFMAVLRTFSPCSNRYIKCSQLLEYKLCIYQYCLQIHSLMFF